MYDEAFTTFEESEKWHYVADSYKEAARFAVKINKLGLAADIYIRYNKMCAGMGQSHNGQIHRNFLSAIILQLAAANYAKADELYQEATETIPDFGPTESSRSAAEILDAFEKSDQELLTQVLARNHNLTFLDAPVARLLKTLKVPEEDAFGIADDRKAFRKPKVEKLDDFLNKRGKQTSSEEEDPFGTAEKGQPAAVDEPTSLKAPAKPAQPTEESGEGSKSGSGSNSKPKSQSQSDEGKATPAAESGKEDSSSDSEENIL